MSVSEIEPLVIAAVFLWIGFACAISFMEAWLKFRAPGVTLKIALSIGRLVFKALNKVEWLFALVIYANLLFARQLVFNSINWFYYVPCMLLLIQTFWILPQLDSLAKMRIKGINLPASPLHFIYVAIEVIKVVSLIIFSFKQFK
jgi:hypothetical protein